MSKRLYGQVTIQSAIEEEVIDKLHELGESVVIEKTYVSSASDIYEVTNMRALSEFAADRKLYVSIIFSIEFDETETDLFASSVFASKSMKYF